MSGPTRQRYRLLSMALPLLAIALWVGCDAGAPGNVVALAGSPKQMGEAYGKAKGEQAKLIVDRYLDPIVSQGDQARIAAYRRQALALVKAWPKEYREEFDAFCAAAKVDRGAIAHGNYMLELTRVPAGCRTAVLSRDGRFYHAHNLDWDDMGGTATRTATIIRRQPNDGRHATVTIGYPGMIGALDIINEHGITLSFNQLGFSDGRVTEPVFLGMRRIAERCDSFEAARQAVLTLPPGMPFIITLSAASTRQASIFERTRTGTEERPMTDGWIAAGNLAQARMNRLTEIDHAVAACQPSDAKSIQELMADTRILSQNNIYSVIFDHAQNRLYLASGKIPAATDTYQEHILFPTPE